MSKKRADKLPGIFRNKQFKKPQFSRKQLGLFIVIFAAIGGFLLYKTFAAGPVVASLESERMTLPSGASIVNDSSASSGQAVKIVNSGTLTGTLTLPSNATSLSLFVKGIKCQGTWPNFSVRVGNQSLISDTVSAASWKAYSTAASFQAGTYPVSISGVSPNTKGGAKCNSDLFIDVLTFYGAESAPAPAPTVSLSASPNTVEAGGSSTLTWSSANSTSCTASGAWSGAKPVSGSASTGALNQTSTYSLTCSGTGGSATGSVSINVNAAPEPPAPPPTSDWPASFFTGPLGQNNILPPTTTGSLVGLWSSGTDATTLSNQWNSRQSHFGRKLDLYGIHYAAPSGAAYYSGHVPYSGAHGETYAINQGGYPLISYMPGYSLSQINSGQADAAFRDVARRAAAWGHRHLYRPFWEFNGSWFSWSGTGQAHIDAWRRVVNIYKQEGANNVGFVWCPDEGNFPGTLQSYPGDEYVDWVCSDRYNWPSGWQEFSHLFDNSSSGAALIHDNFGAKKPYLVGETGSHESSTAGRKAQWITNKRNYIKSSMPYVRGLIYFDTQADGVNWRLDTSTSSMDAFRELVRDSFFNTRNR